MPDFFGDEFAGGREMLKVTNGVETVTVSRGAFECILQRRGFRIVEDAKPQSVEIAINAEEAWAAEQAGKPISLWSKKDIKRFAEIRKIDISAAKSLHEAREIVVKNLQ